MVHLNRTLDCFSPMEGGSSFLCFESLSSERRLQDQFRAVPPSPTPWFVVSSAIGSSYRLFLGGARGRSVSLY